MFYIALCAAIYAALFTYLFYPLLAMPFFGALWLLFPSRRPATAAFVRDFIESAADGPAPGSMTVFILTFLWVLANW